MLSPQLSRQQHVATRLTMLMGLVCRWLNAGTKIGLAKSLLHYYSKYYIAAGKHHDIEYAEQRCASHSLCPMSSGLPPALQRAHRLGLSQLAGT